MRGKDYIARHFTLDEHHVRLGYYVYRSTNHQAPASTPSLVVLSQEEYEQLDSPDRLNVLIRRLPGEKVVSTTSHN